MLATYAVDVPKNLIPNGFPARIAELRKEKGLTQQQLAERVGVHVQQLKRYEAGISQPTLDVIRNMAIAFGVASDQLLFDKDERVRLAAAFQSARSRPAARGGLRLRRLPRPRHVPLS